MQAISEVDKALVPVPPAQEPVIRVEVVRATRMWVKMIQAAYSTRPLDDDAITTWAGILNECDPVVMTGVVKAWLREEVHAPKPAELLQRYHWQMGTGARLKKEQGSRYTADGQQLFDCPYCRDSGYITVRTGKRDFHGEIVYCCPCGHDRLRGNLFKALDHPEYKFDPARGEFVRAWVGDSGKGYVPW